MVAHLFGSVLRRQRREGAFSLLARGTFRSRAGFTGKVIGSTSGEAALRLGDLIAIFINGTRF